MLAEVFLGLLLVWFSHYVFSTYLRRRTMPPGPLPYPFVGNFPQLLCDPGLPFAKLTEKYGDIYSLNLGNIEAVVLGTYSLMREGRIERKDDFAGRNTEDLYPLYELSGENVFSCDYSPAYNFRRKIFTSGFHLFGSGLNQATENMRNAVNVAIEEISSKQGRPFSPNKLFKSAVLIELWQWLTSKKLGLNDPVTDDLNEISRILFRLGFVIPLYQMLPFLRILPERLINPSLPQGKILKKQLFGFEFEQHKKSYNPSVIRDLTDGFICAYATEIDKQAGKDIGSEKHIPNLMMEVVVAGSDTTGTSLTWLLLYMVLNPNVQAKIHEELDLVVGKNRLPTWKDADKMPYLQAVLCELERAASVIPVSWTNAIRDTTVSGYHIRKGTVLVLNLYKMHHDERVWPEPETFKPERFLDSDKKFVGWDKVYGFLPFGLGRRQCPGQFLGKIILSTFASTLLHRFKFTLPEGADIPSSEPVGGATVLLPRTYEIVASERFCD